MSKLIVPMDLGAMVRSGMDNGGGWVKCEICRNEFEWSDETCRETDTGDLCPRCSAEWEREMEQEIEMQK